VKKLGLLERTQGEGITKFTLCNRKWSLCVRNT